VRGGRARACLSLATLALAFWRETPAVAENDVDAAICEDEERARWWNDAWAITFGVAAVASASAATFAPAGSLTSDARAGLYVTATKATIGVAAKLIQPLEIDVKGVCDDRRPESRKTRHALLNEVARRETRALIPNVVGGLLLNSFGLLYLGYGRGAWETGWISFATGSAVAVASVLTAPTQSWLLRRRLSQTPRVSVMPQLGRGAAGAALVTLW
jgi:hypothetical protein